MIPDMLPKVSCRPVAVVLLPYRGVLLGNCLDMSDCRFKYHEKNAEDEAYPGDWKPDNDI